jgi:hypothetical protein
MSDRWLFLMAFLALVTIVAGAFEVPQLFALRLLQSLIYVAIVVMVFTGEDRYSYMLGIVGPLLWIVLAILLGGLSHDLVVLGKSIVGKPIGPSDTPFQGIALLCVAGVVVTALRAWRKQVSEKFFGKTFAVSLVVSLVYIGLLLGWYFTRGGTAL